MTLYRSIAGEAPGRIVFTGGDGVRENTWISDDEARSWRLLEQLPRPWYSSGITIAPWDHELLFASDRDGRGVFRSEDSGKSWQPSSRGIEARVSALLPHSLPEAPLPPIGGARRTEASCNVAPTAASLGRPSMNRQGRTRTKT